MLLWTWIRQKAREAFLSGIGDALAELDAGEDTAPAVEALRQRLLPQLPAPPTPAEAASKRKAKE
jgi:hypothetical protein